MNILVVSDSHGKVDRLCRAVELNFDTDAIIHLGDGYSDLKYVKLPDVPKHIVKGNGEDWSGYRRDGIPRELHLDLGGIKFLLMHGHTHNVKSGYDRAALYAYNMGADVLLFGHTHGAIEKYLPTGTRLGGTVIERPMWVFNPGSIGEPRFGEPKFGLITIRDGQLLLSHGEIDF